MEYNIGDTVKFATEYGPPMHGTIMNVSSEMDSYDEMRLENGVPLYYSKKLKKFVPVKPKNMDSVFIEVFKGNDVKEFVGFNKACGT